MTTSNDHVEYFPGTREPVPMLLTSVEATRVLRLDLGRDESAALKALRHLVARGLLRPCRGIGRENRYARDELRRLVRQRTEQYGAVSL